MAFLDPQPWVGNGMETWPGSHKPDGAIDELGLVFFFNLMLVFQNLQISHDLPVLHLTRWGDTCTVLGSTPRAQGTPLLPLLILLGPSTHPCHVLGTEARGGVWSQTTGLHPASSTYTASAARSTCLSLSLPICRDRGRCPLSGWGLGLNKCVYGEHSEEQLVAVGVP